MILIQTKDRKRLAMVEESELPLRIIDLKDHKKRISYIKKGTKEQSGLYMNNQPELILNKKDIFLK